MQQNGAMLSNNNNMMQNNGNGNAAGTNTQNQQEGGANFLGQQQEESNMNIPGSKTQAVETSSMETGAAVSGTEKYPLTELSHFKDNWDDWEVTDVPMFFHIPKAGGSTVKDIIGTCHRFVMATETGITDGHADDQVNIR